MGLIAEEKMKLLERRFWRGNQVRCDGGASLDKAETASHMDRGIMCVKLQIWPKVEKRLFFVPKLQFLAGFFFCSFLQCRFVEANLQILPPRPHPDLVENSLARWGASTGTRKVSHI